MSQRVALLIGVSQYGEGLPELSATPNDVAALQRVLAHPQMGQFDRVTPLLNPSLVEMQRAIHDLFSGCSKEDLLLLYFSGHGITDDNNHLYLANRITNQADFEATAVPARFIQQQSLKCYTKRQVMILDCCYSGAFAEGWQAKSAGLNLQQELGAEGRAVLTSSTATQTSFQPPEAQLSLYTQYLVEGIATGAADQNKDGKIYVQELHDYAKLKVQEAKPSMQPAILLDREGYNILISQAPLPQQDPELDFRRLVEQAVGNGEISRYRRDVLGKQQRDLGLTEAQAEAIIASVLEPFRRRRANLAEFRQALVDEVARQYPLDAGLIVDLQDWAGQVLGLTVEDIEAVQAAVLDPAAVKYQALQQDAQRLRQQQEAEHLKQQREQQQQEAEALAESRRHMEEARQALGRVQLGVNHQLPSVRTVEFAVVTITGFEKTGLFGLGKPKAILKTQHQQAQVYSEDLGSGVGLELMAIPGGRFEMGSSEYKTEQPIHAVAVPSCWLGKYPVTQAQWRVVAALPQVACELKPDPARFKGDARPVECVSWDEAVEFCARLTQATGREYRLPTEAEWEYACRAGTQTPFYFGETLTTELANYNGNYTYGDAPKGLYRQQTTEVGQFPPNAFGLYDMHGNVWEWCLDHWHDTYGGAPTDGSAWLSSDERNVRVLRGGSWYSNPRNCRSANRNWSVPDLQYGDFGFRVACSPPGL